MVRLGWVLVYAGVFSYAQGIYNSYYTSALAASDLVRRDRRWLLAPLALVLAALACSSTCRTACRSTTAGYARGRSW